MKPIRHSLKSLTMLASLALVLAGCGSVTPLGDGGSPGTAGGSGGGSGTAGAAGGQGTAGSGVAGSQGTAGSGAAGGQGTAGSGGTSGKAGAGGGGGAGTTGAGGHAGATACAQATMVDRSCTTDADCVAVTHTTNCCGSAIWMGIRSSEKSRFSTLETACDMSYPGCGCAAGPPVTDDGSVVPFGMTAAGVSCQAGTCKTFSKACGHPCEANRACTTCMSPDAGSKSFCTLKCMSDTSCTEPGLSRCQVFFAGGTCVDPTTACGGF
jgi:hypothetical protein